MAEGILNFLSVDKNVISKSAGISIVPNSVASNHAAFMLKTEYNVDVLNRKAVQIEYDMIKEADLILTMTYPMKVFLQKEYNEYIKKIFTLKEYAGETEDLNICDPYGGDLNAYELCFAEIDKYIKILLKKQNFLY
ncbi:MAG: low molecular weight protein arginine phosphatase [Oscillospiraceae bacterium]|nr:low molecular weight protein arginine phosphatase [Oscillospiraceae bacterium]